MAGWQAPFGCRVHDAVRKGIAMTTMQNSSTRLRAIKKRLLAEKERLEQELHEIMERTSISSDVEQVTELSTYDDHPADLASETFEREKDLALEGNIQDLLDKVNTALEKIEDSTYGYCDSCGVEINEKRIEALPWASLCLNCQDRMEGR
jgi:RNA polymerase-binding protein DksA